MNNIPTVMILFGGSGDLAHRKIYPALFNLYRRNVIHDNFAVIGTAGGHGRMNTCASRWPKLFMKAGKRSTKRS